MQYDPKEHIYEILGSIRDPEFAQTLEDLKVIRKENIFLKSTSPFVEMPHPSAQRCQIEMRSKTLLDIYWVPTVPHCAYAKHIGLSIR